VYGRMFWLEKGILGWLNCATRMLKQVVTGFSKLGCVSELEFIIVRFVLGIVSWCINVESVGGCLAFQYLFSSLSIAFPTLKFSCIFVWG
jgi:hypothetical protein